jgi:uroporphyrinogen-III synthase/DNA-binding transcriptional regulator YbjK
MKAKSTSRIDTIFDAASALFGERAPESVTMEEIAQRAEVAKGTLYNYFTSKDELLRALLRTRLETLLERAEASAHTIRDAEKRLRHLVEELFRAQAGSPDWFVIRRRAQSCADTRGVLREGEARLITLFRETLAELAPLGRDPERDAALVLGTIDAAVARSLEKECDLDLESEELWRFVRHALDPLADGRTQTKSLSGRTILVTREESEDGELASSLRARGARVVHVALLETLPPKDEEPLVLAAKKLRDYDWLFFTSARAVESLSRFAHENGRLPKIAAVGEATARCARKAGFPPEVVGRKGAAFLVREMSRLDPDLGKRSVLAVLAERARSEGIAELRKTGASVQVVTAYRTAIRKAGIAQLRSTLERDPCDAITFASPSAVEAFARAKIAPGCTLFALGSTTARALYDHGLGEAFTPGRPSFDALAELIARELGPKRRPPGKKNSTAATRPTWKETRGKGRPRSRKRARAARRRRPKEA